MNTTEISSTATAATETEHSGPSRSLVRIILAFAAMLVSLLAVTMTASPAQAASGVTGCFRSSQGGMSIDGVGVQLQAYTTRGWWTVWSGTLPRSQCVTVSTANLTSYHTKLVVNYSRYGATWVGQTPLMALPGYQNVHLGTGVVQCYGCRI